jgi:hypothetical protein
VSDDLPNLERLGILARRYLHDTSNDLTAIGLRLTFLDKSLPAGHPAYEDFQKLVSSCRNLLGHTRELISYRNQWPEAVTTLPLADFMQSLRLPKGWEVSSEIRSDLGGYLKLEPRWFLTLQDALICDKEGILSVSHTSDINANTITAEQIKLSVRGLSRRE